MRTYTLKGYPYKHGRPLPQSVHAKAMKALETITRAYPVESRYGIGKPLWNRFAETWCDSGDESKSLKAMF